MTKTAFIVSFMALAAAGQASANGMPAPGQSTAGATDPCLLGNAADMAACAGMIRVAPGMTVQSQSYTSSSSQNSGPTVLFDPNRGYQGAPTPEAQPTQAHMMAHSAPRQQTMTVTSTYSSTASQSASGSQSAMTAQTAPANQMVSMNCVAPQASAQVACRGYWVPAQQAHSFQTPPMMVQPQPPQVVILQPPSAPSPIMLPPPILPPPTTHMVMTQTMMPPVPCCQQQQEVALIPASFFMGGMSYGVGFPTETSYSYGGGGYAFVVGGTRFSGVRDRVHMDPPPRKPRPPRHKPCGCH